MYHPRLHPLSCMHLLSIFFCKDIRWLPSSMTFFLSHCCCWCAMSRLSAQRSAGIDPSKTGERTSLQFFFEGSPLE